MSFSIDATELQWVNGDKDDPLDLCLHGRVVVHIGDRTLEDPDDVLSVSAAALYLLRSLSEDHIAGEGEHMIPHCGRFMIADDDLQNVTIAGCPYGLDWSVRHQDGAVVLSLNDGTEERVSLDEYREEVFRFADQIEAYYRSCSDKEFCDDFDGKGYAAFWNEWRRRRGRQ